MDFSWHHETKLTRNFLIDPLYHVIVVVHYCVIQYVFFQIYYVDAVTQYTLWVPPLCQSQIEQIIVLRASRYENEFPEVISSTTDELQAEIVQSEVCGTVEIIVQVWSAGFSAHKNHPGPGIIE